MFKMGLEKAEEPEIKLPIFPGSQIKLRNSRKTSTFVSFTKLKPLTVWITTNYGKFFKDMEIPDHLTHFQRNMYAGQEAIFRTGTGHGTADWFKIVKGMLQDTLLI